MTEPAAPPVLEVEDLHTYIATDAGVVRAVDGVSFSVGEREILGLVGESGCGKSVTCRTIAGLMPSPPARSSGNVRLAAYGDRNLLTLSATELQRLRGEHLSMVFQDPMSALNPVMRVGDQIEEAVKVHERLGSRARRTRAIELMERVGIPVPERRMRDYPHQFSGGMRQRLRGEHLSMVFQDPMSALNPVMRVGDQIEEAVKVHERLGSRARRTRAIELMERVGIPVPERRMRDYPHQFSGGMRQRVLIAMAIAGRPKVLLADEPTTALDVLIQDQILSLLLELQRDFGMSMILVSHDLGVIGEMCDRVAVMYAGQIVELADTATLLGGPRHPYTISLLRSLPDVNSESRYLRSIGGAPPALVDVPGGCRFAPRCPLALDQCREWETELLSAGEQGHTARCWRHEETRREDAWPEQSYA